MYNRGMIDDVIVVGTGLLLALLLCGGLVVYEERKDRTGAVSPIAVEFLSASPCLYDTTPIGGTLLSASGENSGLVAGDAISYQLEQGGVFGITASMAIISITQTAHCFRAM